MAWKGTIFGALLGFAMTGRPIGALIGALLGLMFDQSVGAGFVPSGASSSAPVSEVFFRTTFELMGHVAKSDGRVTEAEIDAARRLMQELRLGPGEVAAAIDCFRTGKSAAYDASFRVEQLREACGLRYDLLSTFIELQLRAALDGNGLSPPARAVLMRAAERLGMSGIEFARLESAVLRATARAAVRAAAIRRTAPVGVLCRARDHRGRERSGRHQGVSPADEPPSSRQARRQRPARIDGAVGKGKDPARAGGLRSHTRGARYTLIE